MQSNLPAWRLAAPSYHIHTGRRSPCCVAACLGDASCADSLACLRPPASQPASCLPALLSPARAERRDMSAAEFEPRPTRQLCPAFRHVFLSSPLLVPNVTRPSCYLRSKLSRFLCRLAKRGATKRARLVSRHRQADTGVLRSADPGRYFLCAAQGTSDGPFLLLRPGRAMARPETTARSRLP